MPKIIRSQIGVFTLSISGINRLIKTPPTVAGAITSLSLPPSHPLASPPLFVEDGGFTALSDALRDAQHMSYHVVTLTSKALLEGK